MTNATSPRLSVPRQDPATFERNFIKTATCELRFPILLDLENRPPAKLASALRKEYPHYDKHANVNVRPGAGPVETENLYVFSARGGSWSVTFKSSSIALETNQYSGFKEFSERLSDVLNKTDAVIDSDFFTRVGLRYINILPVDQEDLKDWVNEALVGPLVGRNYGKVDIFHQEVVGRSEHGSFSFRHGIGGGKEPGKTHYVIDFDFFKEDVPEDEAEQLVERLHEEGFSFFLWTLGTKGIERLGQRTPKPR